MSFGDFAGGMAKGLAMGAQARHIMTGTKKDENQLDIDEKYRKEMADLSAQFLKSSDSGADRAQDAPAQQSTGRIDSPSSNSWQVKVDTPTFTGPAGGIGSTAQNNAPSMLEKDKDKDANNQVTVASSKKVKQGKHPLKTKEVMNGLRHVPVEKWRYKPGVADEREHIGPYAEDMQKQFGDTVAPGGKAIDLVSTMGLLLAAVKSIDELLGRLDGKGGKVS